MLCPNSLNSEQIKTVNEIMGYSPDNTTSWYIAVSECLKWEFPHVSLLLRECTDPGSRQIEYIPLCPDKEHWDRRMTPERKEEYKKATQLVLEYIGILH